MEKSMNLENLKKKLQPKHVPFEIEGEKIYIHRPNINDISKCKDVPSTLVYCVKDENGDPIFAIEDIEGRINVNMMDSTILNKINEAILKLFNDADPIEEVEKK